MELGMRCWDGRIVWRNDRLGNYGIGKKDEEGDERRGMRLGKMINIE